MTSNFKKLIFFLITVVLGAVSSGALAVSVNYTGTAFNYSYNDDTNTSIYTLSSSNGSVSGIPINTPWYGSQFLANLWSTALVSSVGPVGYDNFVYSKGTDIYSNPKAFYVLNGTDNYFLFGGQYIVSTFVSSTPNSAAVPEIDGALIPQVGFLIACLFLILGRKKENTVPMLVA